MTEDLPELSTIRHPRHPGVSAALCEALSEATRVCLARHHEPPRTEFSVECLGNSSTRGLLWESPDDTAMRAWNNRDDATRDAAYIVSIAAVEKELGLVAISRAETRSGVDYYVGRPGAVDLEEAIRLEVSGVDHGDLSSVRRRLREKEQQALRGDSPLPAYASVVGFREKRILVSPVGRT